MAVFVDLSCYAEKPLLHVLSCTHDKFSDNFSELLPKLFVPQIIVRFQFDVYMYLFPRH